MYEPPDRLCAADKLRYNSGAPCEGHAGGLIERYMASQGSFSYRIVITGTLPGVCHARGMTSFLYANAIRIFDYPQFAARCAIKSARTRRRLRKPRAPASSIFRRAISAKRTSLPRRLPSAAFIHPRACDLRHGSLRRLQPWHDRKLTDLPAPGAANACTVFLLHR